LSIEFVEPPKRATVFLALGLGEPAKKSGGDIFAIGFPRPTSIGHEKDGGAIGISEGEADLADGMPG
jgi:hypothetical protein